jgi:hypothetical protein
MDASESSYWPIAKASTGGANSRRAARGAGGPDLQEATDQWQTPSASEARLGYQQRPEEMASQQNQQSLSTEAMNWATPDAGVRGGFNRSRSENAAQRPLLKTQADTWATPQARDLKSGETIQDYGNARPLNEQAASWATPRAEDGESCGNHPNCQDSLTGQTRFWKTPHGQGNRDATGKAGGAGGGEFSKQANGFQLSPQDQPTPDGPSCWCAIPGCARPSHKRKLNPIFETWLMGWPIWWLTSVPEHYGALAMASYLYKLRWALSRLRGGS